MELPLKSLFFSLEKYEMKSTLLDLLQTTKQQKSGNLISVWDKDAGRTVTKIEGNLPYGNYLKLIPTEIQQNYIYLQLKLSVRVYFVQLELGTERESVRVTISNQFDKLKVFQYYIDRTNP